MVNNYKNVKLKLLKLDAVFGTTKYVKYYHL